MKSIVRAAAIAVLLGVFAGCRGAVDDPEMRDSIQFGDGSTIKIMDAAVYSNCLNMTLSVRGFQPPPGIEPQAFIPLAESIDLRVISTGEEIGVRPVGGGGGGGGGEEGVRIWITQEGLYKLDEPVAEGEAVTLVAVVKLDQDFGRTDPLRFQMPLIASPGGGSCP